MSVLKYKDALGIWYKIPTIKGDKGDTGNQGAQGIPGVSPTVTVTDITGGHRITITDADHPGGISFDVPNGSPGEGVPTGGTTGQVLKKSSGTDYDTEWGEVPVKGVTVAGSSIVGADGVAAMPIANNESAGAIKLKGYGFTTRDGDTLQIQSASAEQIKNANAWYNPITSPRQHTAVFYGLAGAAGDTTQAQASGITTGNYTENAKSKIHEMLSGSITITGTTPTINALPGLRYICGEVSTLTVNLPASGCVDIQFESGSTPTVLTVNAAQGQTLKWANGFGPTALEADTVYEINVADGLGVAASWT